MRVSGTGSIDPATAQALLAAQRAGDPWAEAPAIREAIRAIRGPIRRNQPFSEAEFFMRVAFGASDCWYWVGQICQLGYGVYRNKKAHRLAWGLFHGPIPDGLFVLHKCDVRACVNPDHLFLGTQQENVADMIAKGRAVHPVHKFGEDNPVSKLTEDMVREMRAAYKAGGVTQYQLADRYGVAVMTINRAIRGICWSKT